MIVGVVLAAGRSSRMGSAKALLTHRGETFLSRIVRALRDGGCDPILVVVGLDDGKVSEGVAAEATRSRATVVVNPVADSEQIDSLRLAIGALPHGVRGIVVCPVDSPGLDDMVVSRMIEAAKAGAPIVIPAFRGRRGHPVLFAARIFPDLLQDELGEGARSVIHRYRLEVVEVVVSTGEILLDIDTPDDYRRLEDGQ